MSTGDKIFQLRTKQGMSQESLAKKCGTSKQTIYKYEKGLITNIPTDKIEAIASVFNVDPSFLVGWTQKEPEPSHLCQVDEPAPPHNTIKIAGRDGSLIERHLTDNQMAALKAIVDQMPDADNDDL